MTLEEKLQHLKTTAMEDARTQTDTVIREYKHTLDTVFEEYRQEKMAQAEITVKAETADVEHKINKALANEHLAVRSQFTRKQHELSQKLFAEVREMLEAFQKTPEYKTLLLRQITKAEDFAGTHSFQVYIDASDAALLPELKAATGLDIRISEESFSGGTRAIIPDRNILIDESFESKLKEEYETFMFDRRAQHE